MRFLVLIVLLVSISATVIPCCAFDDCSGELAAASHPDQNDQKGTCSPFSTCAGCSIAAVPVRTHLMATLVVTGNSFGEMRAPDSLPLYAASFWQPPRTERSNA